MDNKWEIESKDIDRNTQKREKGSESERDREAYFKLERMERCQHATAPFILRIDFTRKRIFVGPPEKVVNTK
jgi:hypothetical protein